ncbi:hypothetical protein [Proteus terrae]|uniref:hypothetical protein n=1 Tax=Proteus terrae TaxID=1574161 RepID=UPI0034D496E6
MKAKKSCAFCGGKKDLTREHIFPSGIIESFETDLITINNKNKYHFRGDLVIKDVCSICNNNALSQLDGYFIKLFKNYMSVPLTPGESITFEYDYNLLLRELLKISYNSARASIDSYDAVYVLKKLSSYILDGKKKPYGIILSLQLVTSSKKIDAITNNEVGTFKPYLLRNVPVNNLNKSTHDYIIRMVAFNSFWFYLFIPKKKLNSKSKQKFWSEYKKTNHLHGVKLKESDTKIKISKEETTYFHPDLIKGMKRMFN